MLALTWSPRPTRVEDSDCVGSSAHKLFPRRARAGAVCQGKRGPLQFYSVDFTAESNRNLGTYLRVVARGELIRCRWMRERTVVSFREPVFVLSLDQAVMCLD